MRLGSTPGASVRHICRRYLAWGNPLYMEDKILGLLKRPNYAPQNAAELRAQLGLRQNQQRELEHVLAQMERRRAWTNPLSVTHAVTRSRSPIAALRKPPRIWAARRLRSSG